MSVAWICSPEVSLMGITSFSLVLWEQLTLLEAIVQALFIWPFVTFSKIISE